MSNDHQMGNDHNLTTAMIVAGNDALSEYWLDLTEGRGLAAIPEVVSCIYLAMKRRVKNVRVGKLLRCLSLKAARSPAVDNIFVGV
jgi:hypothetical protein